MRIFTGKILVLGLVLAGAVGASADWFSTEGPRRQVNTIVVVANYKTPRLIADLIQAGNRQPYLLIPAAESTDRRIFFCTPDGKAASVRDDYLGQFVRYANPRRVVVIGDERYVPRRFLTLLDRRIPLIRIEGEDWQNVVNELGEMLPLSQLPRNFRKLNPQLREDRIYRPISKPAPKAEPAPAAETGKTAPAPAPAPAAANFTPVAK